MHRAKRRHVHLWAMAAGALACNQHDTARVTPVPAVEEITDVAVDLNRDIDILFVIDNSNSMEPEQVSLAENFPRIIDALRGADGLPSLHIGVVTTDIGAGASCPGAGDGGELVNTGTSCSGPRDRYIQDLDDGNGNRITNYDGDLADTFSCIARVGIGGCGFEQTLEAMRLALDDHPTNAGFLRESAYLAVIFVTDEDDCSAADPAVFDPVAGELSSPLGPPTSFRCFEYGVVCDGIADRSDGARVNCTPREDSPYLHSVDRYAQFLRGLKASPQQVILASISGPVAPVSVEVGLDPRFSFDTARLEKSCETAGGDAVPPIRLRAALDGVGARGTKHVSICDSDLSSSVREIAEFIAPLVVPCLRGDLADLDPATPEIEPDCNVAERRVDVGGNVTETLLPTCDNPAEPGRSSRLPCYVLETTEECAAQSATGLSLAVHYPEGQTVPFGARAVARCRGDL